MGYASMVGMCASCNRVFMFNPVRVPSIRRTPDSPREPICEDCIKKANRQLVEAGKEPFSVAKDAYGACDENELP